MNDWQFQSGCCLVMKWEKFVQVCQKIFAERSLETEIRTIDLTIYITLSLGNQIQHPHSDTLYRRW